MKTGNPVFKNLEKSELYDSEYSIEKATSLGIGLKVLYYLIITVVGGIIGILMLFQIPNVYSICLTASFIGGFITSILAMSKPRFSFACGSLYCFFEGMFLGVISLLLEEIIPGIVISTVVSTIAVVLVCSVLFMSGLVKANRRFLKFLVMASIGFLISTCLMYILSLFGFVNYESTGVILLINGISAILASLFLISDMNQAYSLVNNGGPKDLEWMSAFGISYTILWVYLELLRILIVILARSND